jgi:hypothetical protein
MSKGYDSQCGELARYFLADTPVKYGDDHIPLLAQAIQDAIENYMEDIRHDHTCQQCDKVVIADCDCAKGNTTMTWCSSNCRAAYDL